MQTQEMAVFNWLATATRASSAERQRWGRRSI